MVEHDQGGWRLRRPASEIVLQVPETLRQMIGAQIERLNETEQRVLEGAAIAGMTFTPAIRALTINMDPSSFEGCCDALARRNHILQLAGTRELPQGQVVQRYEFVHALYREVLYQRQAPAQRAWLRPVTRVKDRTMRMDCAFLRLASDGPRVRRRARVWRPFPERVAAW
jgi:predicted ATPase